MTWRLEGLGGRFWRYGRNGGGEKWNFEKKFVKKTFCVREFVWVLERWWRVYGEGEMVKENLMRIEESFGVT